MNLKITRRKFITSHLKPGAAVRLNESLKIEQQNKHQ
jgi:hypothetical protein